MREAMDLLQESVDAGRQDEGVEPGAEGHQRRDLLAVGLGTGAHPVQRR